ncbi:hypothetical protein BJ170DRAFT_626646 [Xylariales sp. AK1849]|nr:hypothetical protein BJ170DRAFT_626646 [Xylariales sp. AK1849]
MSPKSTKMARITSETNPSSPTNQPSTTNEANTAIDTHNLAVLNLVGYDTTLRGKDLASLTAQISSVTEKTCICMDEPLAPYDQVTWSPFYFLFYGTLQDEETLQQTTGLSGPQVLRPGRIEGWKSMIWAGPIPMVVPCEGATVKGVAWEAPNPEAVFGLIGYEGSAYKMVKTRIVLDDGEVIEDGRVFVSNGNGEDRLTEGEFDMEAWLNGDWE